MKLATGWTDSQKPSCLDCIFTNKEFLIDNPLILAPRGRNGNAVIALNLVSNTEPNIVVSTGVGITNGWICQLYWSLYSSDTTDLLGGQHIQTFPPSYTNYIEESFTCDSIGLSEVNLRAKTVYRKPQHPNKDTSFGSDVVHSAILGEAASILVTSPCMMFSYSLRGGTLLENWKLAHITNFQWRSTQWTFKLSACSTSHNTHKKVWNPLYAMVYITIYYS